MAHAAWTPKLQRRQRLTSVFRHSRLCTCLEPMPKYTLTCSRPPFLVDLSIKQPGSHGGKCTLNCARDCNSESTLNLNSSRTSEIKPNCNLFHSILRFGKSKQHLVALNKNTTGFYLQHFFALCLHIILYIASHVMSKQ